MAGASSSSPDKGLEEGSEGSDEEEGLIFEPEEDEEDIDEDENMFFSRRGIGTEVCVESPSALCSLR